MGGVAQWDDQDAGRAADPDHPAHHRAGDHQPRPNQSDCSKRRASRAGLLPLLRLFLMPPRSAAREFGVNLGIPVFRCYYDHCGQPPGRHIRGTNTATETLSQGVQGRPRLLSRRCASFLPSAAGARDSLSAVILTLAAALRRPQQRGAGAYNSDEAEHGSDGIDIPSAW